MSDVGDEAARRMCTLAVAMAVEDAATNLRRAGIIQTVVQGVQQRMIQDGKNVDAAEKAAFAAQTLVQNTTQNFIVLIDLAARFGIAPPTVPPVAPQGDA